MQVAYAQQQNNRPVQPPNPSPPGESLTKCPEGWTQVSRQECEKEPEYQCAQDDHTGFEGCQIKHGTDPACAGSDKPSEDNSHCVNTLTGNISPARPFCNIAGYQLEPNDEGLQSSFDDLDDYLDRVRNQINFFIFSANQK